MADTRKSYFAREMRRREFNAVDADKGLATFVDEQDEEIECDPKGGAEWWKSHYYVLKPGELERLLRESDSVYLFGDV